MKHEPPHPPGGWVLGFKTIPTHPKCPESPREKAKLSSPRSVFFPYASAERGVSANRGRGNSSQGKKGSLCLLDRQVDQGLV